MGLKVPILAVGMLLFGTINTITTKFQVKAEGAQQHQSVGARRAGAAADGAMAAAAALPTPGADRGRQRAADPCSRAEARPP
jgi:hypothetical protein